MTPRNALALLALAAFVNLVAGCGGGTVTFGGGGNGNGKYKVTVKGNLSSYIPVTSRDIVAFAYSMDDNSERCPCPADPTPATPTSTTSGKSVVLASGTTDFTLSGLDPGPIGIVFLLDNAGNLADGEINPGDPIAVLDDINCQIDSLAGNQTITLTNVDAWFDYPVATDCKNGVNNPPAAGRARAFRISVATTPAATSTN